MPNRSPKNSSSDPINRKIVIGVIAFHCIFLGIVFFGPTFSSAKSKKPLIVRTVVPASSVKVASASTPQKGTQGKPSAPPKPKPAPQPQKTTPPPKPKPAPAAAPKKKVEAPAPPVKKEPAIADKKPAAPKKSPVKKEPPRAKISDDLLQELQESIAKIDEPPQKGSFQTKKTPSPLQSPIKLQIDSGNLFETGETSGDYTQSMVQYLHQSLHLPEFGEVKIQLTLRQDGTVAKLIVLKTESEKNRSYLESSLPKLRFPYFSGPFSEKKEHTFVLTFCNEL